MTRGIGWYVHHQGAGHLQRARTVAAALTRPCTLIGTLAGFDTGGLAPGLDLLELPDDRPLGGACGFSGDDGGVERPRSLHYAPLNHPGVRARTAAIAAWAARTDPALLVVDVSFEVALLARLLSVPTVVVRLAGSRTDEPHLEAFRSAARILAPFPEALDGAGTPDWVRAKTLYAGFLGPRPREATPPGEDIVVVIGRGGDAARLSDLAHAARAVPERRWHVLGPVSPSLSSGVEAVPPNLILHGWVADVEPMLAPAALVVGGAGDGVVALAVAHGKRFLCLPEPRAYGEQTEKAAALARLGAAVVHEGWPASGNWPALVDAALALDPAIIAGLDRPEAVPDCAASIEAIARSVDRRHGSPD